MSEVKIVITVEGGLVQAVSANEPVDVIIADFDHDGSDDLRLEDSPDGDLVQVSELEAAIEQDVIDFYWRAEKHIETDMECLGGLNIPLI